MQDKFPALKFEHLLDVFIVKHYNSSGPGQEKPELCETICIQTAPSEVVLPS